MTALLLDNGADIGRYLIEKSANPDLCDRNYETPLTFAKKHELHECVSILERAR